ncbi:hypothetical protein GCM10011491_23950 [Brucella endophytica]|uniref:Uncharacterized protein n=1 Tax=Brucella endophytica TaxID=1963359 RepID=A0A916SFH6_9HYPH|nr:hypothetical protein GCM10011491_23950 [Brucella endophytica]
MGSPSLPRGKIVAASPDPALPLFRLTAEQQSLIIILTSYDFKMAVETGFELLTALPITLAYVSLRWFSGLRNAS